MEEAIVERSCTKLKAAVAVRPEAADDLSGVLKMLVAMQPVLGEAKKESGNEEEGRMWLRRVRTAAHDISDMVDELGLADAEKITGIVPKKMEEIKAKLSKMMQDQFFVNLREPGLPSIEEDTEPSIEEDTDEETETVTEVEASGEGKILGRDEDKKKIMAALSASNSIILPIVGVGGIGKTELARAVFNESQFKGYNFRAWVDASEKFDLLEIGESLLCIATGEERVHTKADQKTYMKERLHRLYKGMKVLIVIDGVGEAPGDSSEWRNFKHMLRVDGRGSKVMVIVTTRSRSIAGKIGTVKPHTLNPLSDDFCWKIVKETTSFEGRPDKEELEHIGRQIAIKCRGVPSAARDIGRILKSKDIRGWNMVMNSATWNDEVMEKPGCLGTFLKKNPMNSMVEKIREKVESIEMELASSGSDSDDEDIIWSIATILQRDIDVTETNSEVVDDTIVGRLEEKQSILAELSASNMREGVVILPIYGFGGIGKTALAQLVFKDAQFGGYNFRAWVHVSQNFDLLEIGRSLLSLASGEEPHHSHGIDHVKRCLQDLYKGMKVLVVLDDLWEEDANLLQLLKNLLTVDGERSKVIVIVTTCNENVARKICTVPPYKLNPLTQENCWKIIQQLSSFDDREDKDELEQIGWNIAGKCGGIPLVAQNAGNWLEEEDLDEWSRTVVIATWVTFQCLVLTYRCLPLNLRLCFSYCAIFPKGHNIVKDDLINQWVALDLIQPSDNARELANEYIRKLLDISFLQSTNSSSASGNDDNGAIVFTMHDMVHCLAMAAVGEELIAEEFIDLTKVTDSKHPDGYYCRYARLTNSGPPQGLLSAAKLRVLYCSKIVLSNDDPFPCPSRNLRVLYFTESLMQKLPDFICQMKQLGYLNLSGCSSLTSLPDSFEGLLNLLYIDLSGCSGLVNLPESVGKLIKLIRIDLSGCFGLEQLPESFVKLISLSHIDLSGCSGLVYLPQSFGKLIKLLHINLSGCSRLAALPESFGDLTSLLHINLSRCHQLAKLPVSFGSLEQLEHLDLSFLSCFEEIKEILGHLGNLKHLNLSHPCCFLAERQSLLKGLTDVLGKLTKLQYLNISMFLYPMFGYQPEGKCLECIEFIGELSDLQHLDLSHNMFLFDLPESLAKLSNLCTLDLSGCIRLKNVPKGIAEMDSMKLIIVRNCRGLESYPFQVRVDDGGYSSNLGQLEDVSCTKLEINCLENVKSVMEARHIRMEKKQKLEKLILGWTEGCRGSVEGNALLSALVPPRNLLCLELHGFNGTRLPAWTSSSDNTELVDELAIRKCTKLSFGLVPPRVRRLVIEESDQLMKSPFDNSGNGVQGLAASTTELAVESCGVPLGDWTLLCHLPGVRSLTIKECNILSASSTDISRILSPIRSLCFSHCDGIPEYLGELTSLQELKIEGYEDLVSLPESMKKLTSLQSMHLTNCEDFKELPEWFGSLPSLQKLSIHSCKAIKSLPIDVLKKLKDLSIKDSPVLSKWYESKAIKEKFGHIHPKNEENTTGKQLLRAVSRLRQSEPTRH